MINVSKYLLQISIISTVLGFSVSAWAIDITPDLQLHGYLTADLAKLSENQGQTYPINPGGSSTAITHSDPSNRYDAVAGIQLNYHANDHVNMTFQTFLTTQDESQIPKQKLLALKIKSAHVDYNFNDEWTVRVGRFPFATYLYSDNLRVGEAYPWSHLPTEVYAKLDGIYAENGVSVIYKHTFNDEWILRVRSSFGQENLSSYQVNQLKQLRILLSNENLTLHLGSALASVNMGQQVVANLNSKLDAGLMGLGYTAAQISQYNDTFASTVRTRHLRVLFSDAGFIYDDGHWFAAGELSTLRAAGFTNDFNSGYASVGYHFGKWLPYVVYAHYKDVNLDEINQIPAPAHLIYAATANIQQYSMSVGTRYKLKNNISLKFQADRVSGFDGNYRSGFFLPPPTDTSPSTLKSAYIYSVSVSSAF